MRIFTRIYGYHILPGFVLVSLLLLLAGCKGEEASLAPSPPTVVCVSLKGEELSLTASLPGRVTPMLVSEVRPQVDGIIMERLFTEGAFVQEGDVLYRIDSALYKAALHKAQANLAEAKANLEALARQERRSRALAGERAISPQDLESAVAASGEARARVARARAEVEEASINLAYTKVKAPISGRIGASGVTPGALVTARQAEPLAVIQKLDTVYVDMTQSAVEALRLRRALADGRGTRSEPALRLTLEDSLPYTLLGSLAAQGDRPQGQAHIEGKLLFSETRVSEGTGTVLLRALFPNPEHVLLPGMYVTVHLGTITLPRALLVPQRSVLTDKDGRHFVLVLAGESKSGQKSGGSSGRAEPLFRAERRLIGIERSVGQSFLVSRGLAEGDLVVFDGLQKVRENQPVFARILELNRPQSQSDQPDGSQNGFLGYREGR